MKQVKVFENLIYHKETGKAGMLDVYLPEQADGAPLLIYFHGGGLESGDKWDDHGMYMELVEQGIIVVSANYRMYPEAGYPVYLQDAARAVAYSLHKVKEYASYGTVWIGGISAGGYISMMLHFAKGFLEECGVDEAMIDGYLFDAGQPTTHYNILRERGIDTQAIRVDEAAPLYYLTAPYVANLNQKFLVITASDDIPGRKEQNALLVETMLQYGYEKEQITCKRMEGFTHAAYVGQKDEEGHYPYAEFIGAYILS